MIRTRVDLYGIEESFTRPVLVTMVRNINTLLGIKRNIYVRFDNKESVIKSKTKLGNIRGNNTIKQERIDIEYEEISEPGNELSLLIPRNDFKPIYRDKDIDAMFRPMFHGRKMNITYKYSSKSKSTVYAYINRLRTYTSTHEMYNYHNLEFHYTIPNNVIELLDTIRQMKNEVDKTEYTLSEYLGLTMDNRADIANTLDGDPNKCELIIRERQSEVIGFIEDNLHDIQPEYDDSTGYWSITFQYTAEYEKPVGLILHYPITIYNQVIPKKFRDFIQVDQRDLKHSYNTWRRIEPSILKKSLMGHDKYHIDKNIGYLRIPIYDTKALTPLSDIYRRIFVVSIIVDKEDPTFLFNIDDIPGINFKPSIIRFFKDSEFPYIGQLHASLFYANIYRDGKVQEDMKVIMEHNGDLRTTKPMDIRETYNLSFNILIDLRFLVPESYHRIINYLNNDFGRYFTDENYNEYVGEELEYRYRYIAGRDKDGEPIYKYVPEGYYLDGYDNNGDAILKPIPEGYTLVTYDKKMKPVFCKLPEGKVIVGIKINGEPMIGDAALYPYIIAYLPDGTPLYGKNRTGKIIIGYDDNDNPIYGYLITGKVKTEEGYVYIPTGKVVTGFDEKGNAIFEKDPYSPPKYEPPKSTDTVIGGIYALLNFDKYTTIFREKMGTGEMYVTIDALKAISAKTVAVNTITTLAPIMRDSYKGG